MGFAALGICRADKAMTKQINLPVPLPSGDILNASSNLILPEGHHLASNLRSLTTYLPQLIQVFGINSP